MGQQIPPDLDSWTEVESRAPWNAVLIGNGVSRAIWEPFGYQSLYELARDQSQKYPLHAEDEAVFDWLGTRNFETVLGRLRNAEALCRLLSINAEALTARYRSIKNAMIEAISRVHIPWPRVPRETLLEMREYLRSFGYVFTTNYDLLLYWAIMAREPGPFKDFFWDTCMQGDLRCFHVENTEVEEPASRVFYLHGALHLLELPWGETAKLTTRGGSLLEQFRIPAEDEEYPDIPVVVTEGEWRDKLEAIRRSDYLTFAYEEFIRLSSPTVILGQALGDSDEHIRAIVRRWGTRELAVSIRKLPPHLIVQEKARWFQMFPEASLSFFDSATHPLLSPDLRVSHND